MILTSALEADYAYTSSSCKPNLVVSILTVQELVFGLPLLPLLTNVIGEE